MLADDLANRAQLGRGAEIRPQLPNDGSIAGDDRESDDWRLLMITFDGSKRLSPSSYQWFGPT